MPKIPYQAYSDREPSDIPMPAQRIQTDAGMFGAQVGEGLKDLGRGFAQFSESMERIQNMQDEVTADKAVTENYKNTMGLQEKFLQLNGQQQKDQLESHLNTLEEQRVKGSEGMTNNQKRLYDRQTLGNMRFLMQRATTSTANTFKTYTSDNLRAGILRDEDAIFAHIDDPALVKQDLENITMKHTQLSNLEGVSKQVMSENLKLRLGATVSKTVTNILNRGREPDTADAFLQYFKDHPGTIPNSIILQLDNDIYNKRLELDAMRVSTDAALGTLRAPSVPLPRPRPEEAGGKPQKKSEISPGSPAGSLIAYAEAIYTEPNQALGYAAEPRGDLTIDARAKEGVRTDQLHPEFREKLNAAVEAAEKATGAKATIMDAYRDPKRQAQYRADYTGEPVQWEGKTYFPQRKGGLAAPPGQSRHQSGKAADLKPGAVLSKLHEWAEAGILLDRFGLEFLGGRSGRIDPVHIQLASR